MLKKHIGSACDVGANFAWEQHSILEYSEQELVDYFQLSHYNIPNNEIIKCY